jgi:nitrile hydratase accessory protein
MVMESGSHARSLSSGGPLRAGPVGTFGRNDEVKIPRDQDGPVFREPWEAQAFAIAVTLNQRGLFTWSEWATVLGEEIKKAQAGGDPDTGETYYRHWLAALEHLVAEKGITDTATLARTRDAWDRAADRTPHGTPIELKPEDFRA